MNLYYIINGRLPTEKANGYQISQMCQAFSECGVNVELLRPNRVLIPAHSKFRNNLKEFYHLRLNLKIVDIWSIDFQDICHRLHKSLDRIQFITNLMHSISFVLGLCFFFHRKKKAGGLIYLRDINIMSWFYFFLPNQFRKNIIFELHYLPEELYKRQRYARILSKARAVVAITNKMREDLLVLGLPAEKVLVEHDGVDLGTFTGPLDKAECRKIFAYSENDLIVGYVGNFHTNGKEKGIDDLLRAAVRILQKIPNVKFYFVGGPMDRVAKYKKIIDDLKMPQANFSFFDRRPVAQVPASMGACDVLVIPLPWNPYFSFYMSPMKLFEYMASGRCIVATNVESLCEILHDGKNAILAKHSDEIDLADKILFSIDEKNKELVNACARQAFTDVQEHSWKKRAERILNHIGSTANV